MAIFHQDLDERSLAMHRLIAKKLRNHPELFVHCQEFLARCVATSSPNSLHLLLVWQDLFAQGMEVALEMALGHSERATELRQSAPFVGVLTQEERLAFLDRWRKARDAGPGPCPNCGAPAMRRGTKTLTSTYSGQEVQSWRVYGDHCETCGESVLGALEADRVAKHLIHAKARVDRGLPPAE